MKIINRQRDNVAGSFLIGRLTFGDKVVVTDPCYNSDVWCRMNDVPITPGEYVGAVRLSDEGEWGIGVATIGIYKDLTLSNRYKRRKEWRRIGGIGVDAGLAGIFAHKADFSDDQWVEFCNDIHDGNAWAFDDPAVKGFCSPSGYGDGCYDVFGHPSADDPDVFDAIEIHFL